MNGHLDSSTVRRQQGHLNAPLSKTSTFPVGFSSITLMPAQLDLDSRAGPAVPVNDCQTKHVIFHIIDDILSSQANVYIGNASSTSVCSKVQPVGLQLYVKVHRVKGYFTGQEVDFLRWFHLNRLSLSAKTVPTILTLLLAATGLFRYEPER